MRFCWMALCMLVLGCADGRSSIEVSVESNGIVRGIDHFTVVVSDTQRGLAAAPINVALAGAPVNLPPTQTFFLNFDASVSGPMHLALDAVNAAGSALVHGEADVVVSPSKTIHAVITLPGEAATGDMGGNTDGNTVGDMGGDMGGDSSTPPADPPGTVMIDISNQSTACAINFNDGSLNSGGSNDYDVAMNGTNFMASVGIISVGPLSGLASITQAPASGYTAAASVQPDYGYVVKTKKGNYARVYVVRWLTSTTNEIIGARLKYTCGGTTFVPLAPTSTTNAATNTSSYNFATLNGTINPNGWDVTSCYFDYGTSLSYGNSTPVVSLPGTGINPVTVTATIFSLLPTTTYNFRVVAINAGGTTEGSNLTFTTVDTITFNHTGSQQTWVVPLGVTSIQVDTKGAQGGGTAGGAGARVQTTLSVTPTETLYIYVGGQAGYNGGGVGGAHGSGGGGYGGGAADIRQGGTALSNRVVIAGGGGGSSANGIGGGTGGVNGQKGADVYGVGSCCGGGGGTQTGGGAGGTNGVGTAGSGVLGVGGDGVSDYWSGGGGGGGGYYGGGGGGSGGSVGCAGGGGGSSYSAGTSPTYTDGYQSGNGQISITLL